MHLESVLPLDEIRRSSAAGISPTFVGWELGNRNWEMGVVVGVYMRRNRQ